MNSNKNKYLIAIGIAYAVIAYFALFWKLDARSIRLWDEGLYAVNAYEMSQGKHPLVRYYKGEPMGFNTKPPLVTWVQALLFKTIGPGRLAMRLPSAFAMLAVSLLLIWFAYKKLDRPLLGLLMGLGILLSPGLIWQHVARTGDTDAILSLWVVGLSLTYFQFLYSEQKQSKYLLLSIVFLWLGVMTKGIAILMMGPGLLITTLLAGRFKQLITNRWLYSGGAVFIILSLGYYLLAEQANPGFLHTAWEREIASRFFGNIDNHQHPFSYYINNMYQWAFMPWLVLIPVGIAFSFFAFNNRVAKFVQYSSVLGISFLLLISISRNKLDWYMAPALCLLIVPAIYSLYYLFYLMKQQLKEQATWQPALLMLLLFAGLSLKPYLRIINENSKYYKYGPNRYWEYLKHINKTEPATKQLKLFESDLNPHMDYASVYYSGEELIKTEALISMEQIEVGDTIICCFWPDQQLLQDSFETQLIENYHDCKRLHIIAYPKVKQDSLTHE